MAANGHRASFWVDENVQKSIVVTVIEVCKFTLTTI